VRFVSEKNVRDWQLKALVLRRARELGLTVSQVAYTAGIARPYLYKLMDGSTRDPSVRTLTQLGRALQLPPLALMRHFQPAEPRLPVRRPGVCRTARVPGDAIGFCADITIPEFSLVAPGERFTKTWSIRNVGDVYWMNRRVRRVEGDYVLARRDSRGVLMAALHAGLAAEMSELSVPNAQPGQAIELSVDFIAPPEPGCVVSCWRMVDADGEPSFGHEFVLKAIVTVTGH